MVTTLSSVVINVMLETSSGFESNCTAYIVVVAADGIAAETISTLAIMSFIGKMTVNAQAISGEPANLSTAAYEILLQSKFLTVMFASCIPRRIIMEGIVASPPAGCWT